LIEGFFHRVFYRINQAALTLEAGGVGNRAQPNAAVSPDEAYGHTIAAKSCSEIVSGGNRHPLQSGLLTDCGKEVERRCGSSNIG
jgi:hypothetical protein